MKTCEAAEGDKRADWEAFCEFIRIDAGKDGNLHRLRELTVSHPCSGTFNYLGAALNVYGQFGESARQYEIAAEMEDNSTKKVRLLGRAAVEHARDGAQELVITKVLSELKSCALAKQSDEEEILYALRNVAEVTKDDQMQIGVMQRVIELDPSDTRTRFSVAFKHSEVGNDDLALFHYLKIPANFRDHMTWNNLGVSFGKAKLHSKAVEAFRKAEEARETLAMSNLAYKFLSVGFLAEARKLIEEALKTPNCHSNIARAMAELDQIPEREQKALEEVLEKVRPASDFYTAFGKGVSRKQPSEISKEWTGIEGTLNVKLEGSVFSAKAQYERPSNLLMGLASFGIPHSDRIGVTERWRVEYCGSMHGCAIEGHVIRERLDEHGGAAASLLSAYDASAQVLMILSEDGGEFQVMETPRGRIRDFTKSDKEPIFTSDCRPCENRVRARLSW